MSDTIDLVDPGTLLVPPATGDNTTETYGVFYPFDGLFVASGSLEGALTDAAWAREAARGCTERLFDGAVAVQVTITRLDP